MRKDLAKLFGFEREFNENTLDIFIDDKSKTIRISGESANKKCDIKFQDLQFNGLAQYCCTYKEYIVEFVFCSFNYLAIDNFIINSSICIPFRGFKFVQCEFKDKTHFVYQTGTLIFQDCVFSNFALFEKLSSKCKLYFKNIFFKNICEFKEVDYVSFGSVKFQSFSFENDQISLKIENNNEKYNSFDVNSLNKFFAIKAENSKDDYPIFSQISFKENLNEYKINLEYISINNIDFTKLKNSLHNKKLNIKHCALKNGFDFKDEIFNDIEFNTCTFKESVYFIACEFKEKTTFCACVFENIASFYNSTFEKVPNFSASYFKEQKAVNLINVNMDKISFESVERYVDECCEKDIDCKNELDKIKGDKENLMLENEKDKNILMRKYEIERKYKTKYIKDIKDSFRTIKDVLIEQNNNIEASLWHKLELYAKEKEIKENIYINSSKEEVYNPKDYKKFDCRKLFHICKNLFVMSSGILIKLFKIPFIAICYLLNILSYCLKFISYLFASIKPLDFYKFVVFWKSKFRYFGRKISKKQKPMVKLVYLLDCFLLQLYRNTSDHHTNLLTILNFTIAMIVLYGFLLHICTQSLDFISRINQHYIFALLYLLMLVFIFIVSFAIDVVFVYFSALLFFALTILIGIIFFFKMEYIYSLYLAFYILIIFVFYLFFTTYKIQILRVSVMCVVYTCFIFLFISTPQLLNPFVGIFSSDKLYESKFEKSLSELNSSSVSKILDIMQENFENKNSDLNMTFTELNSAKDYIKANKNIIIDVNLTKAKNIMPNYENIAKSAMQDELVQNVIKSTSILYAIILLLCIFSLQKTARKNSIVPN